MVDIDLSSGIHLRTVKRRGQQTIKVQVLIPDAMWMITFHQEHNFDLIKIFSYFIMRQTHEQNYTCLSLNIPYLNSMMIHIFLQVES